MSAPEPETWVRLRPRRLDTSGPDRPGRRSEEQKGEYKKKKTNSEM
jgi:hypothetical protein